MNLQLKNVVHLRDECSTMKGDLTQRVHTCLSHCFPHLNEMKGFELLSNAVCFVSVRTLIPILHQKAKRGTPHQAKQAVHCIHAIFNNKEVQLAQIFEVGGHFLT